MTDYFLSKGSHTLSSDGRCAMEWVAYIAGEEHSDSPPCVSPVLRRFGISLNDNWDDEQRQKLRPCLARCIGTAGDGRDNERAWLATDWLIREYLPAFLDLTPGLVAHAECVRSLPPVLAVEQINHTIKLVNAARDAAGDVAWDAARDAAGAAARDAARAAAWDAARDALAPTVLRLQVSALTLFDRMLPTEILTIPAISADEVTAICGAGATT